MASNLRNRNYSAAGIERHSRSDTEAWYSLTLTNYERGRQREPFVEATKVLAKTMVKLFGARLHWGKLCPLSIDEVREQYPAFGEFQAYAVKWMAKVCSVIHGPRSYLDDLETLKTAVDHRFSDAVQPRLSFKTTELWLCH